MNIYRGCLALQRTCTPLSHKLLSVDKAHAHECHVPRQSPVSIYRQTVKTNSFFVRYCHNKTEKVRKRPRWDRIGYQHEDKIKEILERFDSGFCRDEFFRGVAETFLHVTNYIHDENDEALASVLSTGGQKYVQWVRDEASYTGTCYSEVIFPVEERDIFSLVVNNVDICDDNSESGSNGESTVDITVTITYGKNHRVIFGIPDSYLCSFAIFKFQRTFVEHTAQSDWMIDRIQYYPPR